MAESDGLRLFIPYIVASVLKAGFSVAAMTLHCGVRNDITLLGFHMSESLEHTFLACIRIRSLPD